MSAHLPGGTIPSTPEEWIVIQEKIELHARAPYSAVDKRVLWCQGIIVLISGVLYLVSLLRRATISGLWCFKRDVDGYWHPNIHVAIPIVTITHAAIQCAGIGLIVIADSPEGKISCIVTLNLIACSLLYFAGWTKIWAVLYALPSSIFRLRRRDVLGATAMITKRRILSPNIFNGVILSGYLVGLIPIPWLSFTVYWVQQVINQLHDFKKTTKHLIAALSKTPQDLTITLFSTLKAGEDIKHLRDSQNKALKNLRIFSGVWLVISFGALVIFLGGSFALLLALTRQIDILGKIQKQRELLINSRYSVYQGKTVHALKAKCGKGKESHPPKSSLFSRIKLWIPTLAEDDEEDPLGPPPPTSPPQYHVSRTDSFVHVDWPRRDVIDPDIFPKGRISISNLYENAHRADQTSRKNRKRLVKYCVRFAWQVVFCTLIAASYIILNIVVAFNLLDAPHSISLSQLFRKIEQWAAWSWGGGPGAILGFLACVVAFSRNPSLPREPEKGPPVAPDANYTDDTDGDEYDDPYGTRTRQHSLTVEKLNLHGLSDNKSADSYLKQPSPIVTSLNGSGSWKDFRQKFGFGSHSTLSRSSLSKIQYAPSEASTGISRAWSPFQILSLNSSNIISMHPAKPYPLVDLHKASNLNQNSNIHSQSPEKVRSPNPVNAAYHYPTRVVPGRQKQAYPLPVQVSRSEPYNSRSNFLASPDLKKSYPTSPTDGHFDAIHQLRDRQ